MKTYIITGTSKGLGEAFVSTLSDNKNNFIIAISRTITEGQKKLDKNQFKFIKTDLFNVLTEEFFDLLKAKIKTNDVVFINNAASINPIRRIGKFNIAEINNIFKLNVINPVCFINFLVENNFNKLKILNISSGAANKAIDGWSLYCSSKASVNILMNVAKLENPKYSFINLDPGVMDTKMQESIRRSDFKDKDKFVDLKDKNELRSPVEVAKEILNTN